MVYMLIKQFSFTSSVTLHELKDLYAYSIQGAVNKSRMYYMELVDEHPDSTDTLRCVSDLLLHTVSSEFQNGYVIWLVMGRHTNI